MDAGAPEGSGTVRRWFGSGGGDDSDVDDGPSLKDDDAAGEEDAVAGEDVEWGVGVGVGGDDDDAMA
jgi:hypothetical protein